MNQPDEHAITPALTLLMSLACGAMVANIYYAQTLIDVIAPDVGLTPWVAGAIITLTQLGYGLGLAAIVPLSDLFENKRLVLVTVMGAVAGSLGVALSGHAVPFLVASLLLGICSVGAQVLLPLASHLSSPARQGRTIGMVMSGLLTGIMLARPISSMIAEVAGWRAVFFVSAGVMALVAAALALWLPSRRPEAKLGYGAILRSTAAMVREYPALRLRAYYQALLFLAFNLFWTAAPLVLIHEFHMSHAGIAAFALAGAGGALAAPIAGHLADHGKGRLTTLCALLLLTVSFLAADWAVAAGSVIAFTVMAVLIDAAVQLNQISGQRVIFSLAPEKRGRINAAYMTILFVVGAMGSLVASASYAYGGWSLSAMLGAAIGLMTLAGFALFDRKQKVPRTQSTPNVG